MLFFPKYKFVDLHDQMPEKSLKTHCFDHGKFCVEENSQFSPLSVLEEGLRQICVWNVSKTEHHQLWWDYITVYHTCLRAKINGIHKETKSCFEVVRENMFIHESDLIDIEKCIKDSFSDPTDKFNSENKLLNSQIDKQSPYRNMNVIPAIFVNDDMIKEEVDSVLVMSAICNSLKFKPESCGIIDLLKISFKNENKERSKRIIQKMLFLGSFLICFLVFIICWIKKYEQSSIGEEFKNDVHNHVTEYMKLNEKKNETTENN